MQSARPISCNKTNGTIPLNIYPILILTGNLPCLLAKHLYGLTNYQNTKNMSIKKFLFIHFLENCFIVNQKFI
jgi:hypothetical protein